jgi:dihydropteroate synthase
LFVSAPFLRINGRLMTLTNTLIMAVVNASPESFSDAGMYGTLEQQIEQATRAIEAGANIIDIGGQSAITNEPELDPAAELRRVLPLIESVRSRFPEVPISVDTYKPLVARTAIAAGASMVNDVSGLLYPEIADICAATGAALVIMHTRARPKMRLQDPQFFSDVTRDVVEFLQQKMDVAESHSVPTESIILDPGLDFGKTPHQTIAVLRNLDDVYALNRPLLLALSRKDFLGAILQKPPKGRDAATLAAIAHLVARGGNVVRVHDVAATADVVKTIDVLTGRSEIPADYLLPPQIRHEPGRSR